MGHQPAVSIEHQIIGDAGEALGQSGLRTEDKRCAGDGCEPSKHGRGSKADQTTVIRLPEKGQIKETSARE